MDQLKAHVPSLLRQIRAVLTGSSASQLIIIASSPIITRLYDAEAFGILAIFTSVVAVLSVVGCLRYEIAIVLPTDDEEAFSILKLCVILNVIVAGLVTFGLFLDNWFAISNVLGHLSDQQGILPLIVMSLVMVGSIQVLNFWHSRRKNFWTISLSKILQSSSLLVMQLSLVFFWNANGYGLIYSVLFSQLLTCMYFVWSIRKDPFPKRIERIPVRQELGAVARKYKRFPAWSMPGALLNSISTEFPVFIIAATFGLAVVGPYSLALRVLSLPAAILSSSIYQVLVSRFAEMDRSESSNLFRFILWIFACLFFPALFVAFIFQTFGVTLFEVVFGAQWTMAGNIAVILIFSQVFKFSISPLSAVLGFDRNVHLGFYWQAGHFLGLTTLLFFVSSLDVISFITLFVTFECISYTIHFIIILWGAKRERAMK